MPDFPLQERHIKQVKELYALRSRLLDQFLSNSRSVIDLERRLSIHLNILAQLADEDFSPNGMDEERFLFFATALQSQDEEFLFEICAMAVEQLSCDDLSHRPIFDAFSLYPPSVDLMLKLYNERPSARAEIFSIWQIQNADLPAGLINQAELQSNDPSLQYEVLSYAANHPAFGVDIFRSYYSALLAPAGQFPLHESLLEPVLWGGLVRGDIEASTALRRSVEQVSSIEIRTRLLRLMALNGSPDHMSVLEESFAYSNDFNSRLWALAGMAEHAHHLIKQLGLPEQADNANSDWRLLTGDTLPDRPALMLVDDSGKNVAPDSDVESRLKMVPDTHYAQSWLESRREEWRGDRWIMGKTADIEWLSMLCRHYCGEAIDDLVDLLSLKLQQPLGSSQGYGWQKQRIETLNMLGREKASPDSVSAKG
jgi:hypothetical protein